MTVISDCVNTTQVLAHLVSTKPHEMSRNMNLMLKNEHNESKVVLKNNLEFGKEYQSHNSNLDSLAPATAHFKYHGQGRL